MKWAEMLVGTWLDAVIDCSIAMLPYDILQICTFANMAYNMVDSIFTVVFPTILQHFAWSLFASCWTPVVIRVIPVAVCH